jgi:hypothetical protein
LLYAAALHLLAGALTGTIFKIRTLLILSGFVFLEAFALALVQDQAAGLWALANLVTIQIGYFAGVYGRGILERAGYAPEASAHDAGRHGRGYADR